MLNFHPPTRSNRDKIAEQGHISTCSFALNDSTCEHRDFGRRGGSPRTLPAGSREPQGSRGTPPLRSIVISQQVYTSLNERGRSPTTRILSAIMLAAVSTLLGVGAELGADSEDDLTRALRRGSQDTINQTGQQIVRRQLNVQPTLTIRPGHPLRVVITRDLVLEPLGATR